LITVIYIIYAHFLAIIPSEIMVKSIETIREEFVKKVLSCTENYLKEFLIAQK